MALSTGYLSAVTLSSAIVLDYSTHAEGTGLGLAIVEAIAQAHGWEVAMIEGSEGGARVVFGDVDVVEEVDAEPDPVATG